MKGARAFLALDKLGAVGALVAAAAAPCCFPLLATVGAVLGLGALQGWRGYSGYAIQGFALLSAAGNAVAFRRHRRVWPLAVSLASVVLVFFAYYISFHVFLVYAGLLGLAVSALGNFTTARGRKACSRPVLSSIIKCPSCGHQKEETMPTDACLYFYECQSCHATLRPKPSDCCVFCSYGSVKCPPVQAENCCGGV